MYSSIRKCRSSQRKELKENAQKSTAGVEETPAYTCFSLSTGRAIRKSSGAAQQRNSTSDMRDWQLSRWECRPPADLCPAAPCGKNPVGQQKAQERKTVGCRRFSARKYSR